MSLVAAIRDYIDFINSNYEALPLEGGLPSLFIPTFKYMLESLKYSVLYLATFQWLRDFMYLPLIVPQLTLSILRETCHPFDNPALNFLSFLEMPAYRDNSFVIGLLNSFFASFPISAGHILSGRRLLVQGIPAGLAAGSGMILGQWGFVVCVIMGIRPLVVPWLALEPFNYFLGVILLVNIVYRITHERRIRIVRWSDKKELVQYFLISFLLSWCEQTSLFQYLGNLTIDAGTNLLDNSALGGSYVGGLLIGTCLFSLLFALLALGLRRIWLRWGAVTSSRLTNQLDTFSLVALIALSFASVPYYGVDYLLTNQVGFRSQDMALEQTAFVPATTDDTSKRLGSLSDYKSFDTDVSTFDRGLYLQEFKPVPQSFEDLNYQGEYGWTKRVSKYTKYLVKRKAPLAWSDLFKRIGENDNLRLRNAKDQEREQQNKLKALVHTDKSFSISSSLATPGQRGDDPRTSTTEDLENDAVKYLASLAMIQNSEDVENGIGERLQEDNETENQFLSMFDTSLSPLFINDMPEPSALEKRLKKKLADNPLYPLLLHVDIDSFLNRQPTIHSLSPREEEALLQKRNILGQYYDTLRQYSQLQNSDHFQTLYHGSKSFANRVYNQQFKGTLKVVRRLFSITLSERENKDQISDTNLLGSWEKPRRQGPLQDSPRALKFDQPLFHRGANTVFNIHEELTPYMQLVTSPFVESAEPRPLYAGWDEELRRLVLTNRSLSRSEATYKALPADQTINHSRLGVHFTSWPLSDVDKNSGLVVPHQLGFNSAAEPRNQKLTEALDSFAKRQDQASVGGNSWEMSYWPTNLRLLDDKPELLAYKRGGFVWPGHSSLRFHLHTK